MLYVCRACPYTLATYVVQDGRLIVAKPEFNVAICPNDGELLDTVPAVEDEIAHDG